MKKLDQNSSENCLLRRRRIAEYVAKDQKMHQLKGGDPEQCVSSARRVFTENASHSISTLSDICWK
jgi:hypothetical protein